jgi:predicted TIM-barrel fold metal-dependent hydrolase
MTAGDPCSWRTCFVGAAHPCYTLDGRLDRYPLLYAHPGVHVDVGALQAEFMVPRANYYRHLRGLVEAGFAKRILFGSDFPNQVRPGIDAIMAADFLSADQKADILCNNAARFLRLDTSMCKP